MTARDAQVEKGADALEAWDSAREAPENEDLFAWDRMAVAAVLDAVLPQVTTVAELAQFPVRSTVVAPTLGNIAWVFEWTGRGLYHRDTDTTHPLSWVVERYGPLTVVWQPEVVS